MRKRVFQASAVFWAGSHAEAWSHPGHGELQPSSSPLHYVLEPVHLWPWLLAGAVILCLLAARIRMRRELAGVRSEVKRSPPARRQ